MKQNENRRAKVRNFRKNQKFDGKIRNCGPSWGAVRKEGAEICQVAGQNPCNIKEWSLWNVTWQRKVEAQRTMGRGRFRVEDREVMECTDTGTERAGIYMICGTNKRRMRDNSAEHKLATKELYLKSGSWKYAAESACSLHRLRARIDNYFNFIINRLASESAQRGYIPLQWFTTILPRTVLASFSLAARRPCS